MAVSVVRPGLQCRLAVILHGTSGPSCRGGLEGCGRLLNSSGAWCVSGVGEYRLYQLAQLGGSYCWQINSLTNDSGPPKATGQSTCSIFSFPLTHTASKKLIAEMGKMSNIYVNICSCNELIVSLLMLGKCWFFISTHKLNIWLFLTLKDSPTGMNTGF